MCFLAVLSDEYYMVIYVEACTVSGSLAPRRGPTYPEGHDLPRSGPARYRTSRLAAWLRSSPGAKPRRPRRRKGTCGRAVCGRDTVGPRLHRRRRADLRQAEGSSRPARGERRRDRHRHRHRHSYGGACSVPRSLEVRLCGAGDRRGDTRPRPGPQAARAAQGKRGHGPSCADQPRPEAPLGEAGPGS